MASKKREIPTKSPTEVPEVQEFLGAAGRLEAFRQEHAQIFEQFDKLAEEYNQKLEVADQTVRGEGIACGPFDLYQYNTKYHPKVLYDLVGHEKFLKVGGSTHTETVYEVDKTKVEMAIEQGVIPSDAVDAVRTVTPVFHTPKKISTS